MSNQQIQKVKVKRLAHVGLWATDVTAQARFYHQVLGLDLRSIVDNSTDPEEEDANLYLALGAERYCLGLFNDTRTSKNGRNPDQQTQLHHLTFEVDTDAELAALAARLKIAGVEVTLAMSEDVEQASGTLWLADPDGNTVEVAVAQDPLQIASSLSSTQRVPLRPYALQHLALYTARLEAMVEFYTESLGFDISDWLLRERAWLRCNNNHHTIMLIQGKPGVDHIGYSIANWSEILRWADHLSHQQVPLVWGPGRHGTSNDLFLRLTDPDGIHIELSADMQQYFDRDVTIPPRLWHTRQVALNLWGLLPSWIREEAKV